MARLVKRRNKRRKTAKSEELAFYGNEPVSCVTPGEQVRANNWYSRFYGSSKNTDDRFKFLLEYANDRDRKNLQYISDKARISPSICYMARMLTNKCQLSDENVEWFKGKFAELVQFGKDSRPVRKKKVVRAAGPKLNPYQRLKIKTSEQIAELEGEVDQFIINGKSDFSCYEWFKANGVNAKAARLIKEYYAPQLDEPEIDNKYRAFIQSIVDDCDAMIGNAAKTRKPRAKVTKSVDKKVAKVKFCKEHAPLKLVSELPEKIVGAEQVWVYDIRGKMLSVYNALDPKGLDISRSSIRGFDPNNSTRKRLGRPEKYFASFKEYGKVQLRKAMSIIKTKELSVSGRLNDNMIIVKVVR